MTGSGRKRREIIIETERIVLVSHRTPAATHEWCERCGHQLPMLTVEEAAAAMRLTVEEILRRIGNRELHFVRMAGGAAGGIRICPCSLAL